MHAVFYIISKAHSRRSDGRMGWPKNKYANSNLFDSHVRLPVVPIMCVRTAHTHTIWMAHKTPPRWRENLGVCVCVRLVCATLWIA